MLTVRFSDFNGQGGIQQRFRRQPRFASVDNRQSRGCSGESGTAMAQ